MLASERPPRRDPPRPPDRADRYADANGIRFAYRRSGKTGGVPLVFQHPSPGRWTTGTPAL
ncbi:hypothetical protein ACFFYR_11960 [Paraburkholderia dipogonis]|uniref:hypothetical protein n=1 Tax=Paraburkholderia dipogonis TaxID=1211383 RepID=UPI0035E909A6